MLYILLPCSISLSIQQGQDEGAADEAYRSLEAVGSSSRQEARMSAALVQATHPQVRAGAVAGVDTTAAATGSAAARAGRRRVSSDLLTASCLATTCRSC